MSSSHNGRLLTLPLVWGRGEENAAQAQDQERQESDEDLMRRLQSDDCNALDALFQRYSRLVFGIALRTVRNRGEAEDVVQDVFFYIYRKSNLFDSSKGSAKG